MSICDSNNMREEKSFKDLVFAKTKLIPKGKVSTYGGIALAIGKPRAARTVGNALNKNCDTAIPCHRVIKSDGRVGGYNKGSEKKNNLLLKEGVLIEKNRVNLKKYLYEF